MKERRKKMEKDGLQNLMKDLGVKTYKELDEYINSEEHQDEQIVKELKEFINYVKQMKERK